MATRVLIVEDERHIIESLTFVLESEGFEVAAELDGEAGLRRLRADRPDVLVLDLMMPKMNGLEVLRPSRPMRSCARFPSWCSPRRAASRTGAWPRRSAWTPS